MSPTTRSTPATPTTRAATPRTTTPARVAFVGAGPGDAGLLTMRAVEYLADADAVVMDQLAREDVVGRCCRDEIDVVDAGYGETGQPLTQASRAKLVVKAAKAHPGGLVVRLMDGDPATFNGLAEEAAACAKAGIPFEVVPGVSSVSAVPAYAGVPLTAGGSSAVHVIGSGTREAGLAAPTDPGTTVVVLGGAEALCETLAGMLDERPGPPVAGRHRHPWDDGEPVELAEHPRRGAPAIDRVDGVPVDGDRRRHRPAARGAVLVRDEAALRLERPRAADEGAVRRR